MSKKKIIIPIVIVALLVGAFFGAKRFRTANTTVDVVPVSYLNWGYMEDSMSIDGVVYDEDSQSIYPDATQIISEIYVKEGQEVKKGDKLLAYDMASQELTLQIRRVAVEKAENNLYTAQAELNALYNTTPVPDYVTPIIPDPETPTDPEEPEEPEIKKPEHKKVKDAWNYLDDDNINDYYLSPIVTVINNHNGSDMGVSGEITRETSGSEADPSGTESGGNGGDTAGEGSGSSDASGSTGSDSGSNAGDANTSGDNDSNNDNNNNNNNNNDNNDGSDDNNDNTDGGEDVVEIDDIIEPPEDGSINNPYRYMVTEDGVVYGSFLNALRKKEDRYAVIEIREGNTKDGDLLASMTLSTKKIKEQDDDAYWYVILRADGDDPFATLIANANIKEEDTSGEGTSYDYGTDYFNTEQPIQYTAEELARAIQDKQRDIKNLDLNLRRVKLDLKVLEEQMEDGVVTAKRDGVVTTVHDIDNPPQDGSPFLKVDAGSGVVVQGTISELLLEKISLGQEITAMDWESGGSYVGEITSIDDYPADQSYYYGGNQNSSYYGFLAYFNDAENLDAGHWLQMSLDANAQKENALYIPNAYIRSDAQGKYMMKDDGGILTKQYVKCGKGQYGYVTEILEGITDADYIAFPYGDGAKEGAKTKISEEEVMW